MVLSDADGNQETLEAAEPLSGEMTWSPDGQALLLAPWDADSSSTLVDLSTPEPSLSSVSFEFDASRHSSRRPSGRRPHRCRHRTTLLW